MVEPCIQSVVCFASYTAAAAARIILSPSESPCTLASDSESAVLPALPVHVRDVTSPQCLLVVRGLEADLERIYAALAAASDIGRPCQCTPEERFWLDSIRDAPKGAH